jgi:hypothetical protein
MSSSPALAARERRILAGRAAGAALLDLAIAEEVDPAVVRRVLRAAGIDPGPIRTPRSAPVAPTPACLADLAWLRAEYATKGAKEIAKELGCSRERVYEALNAAGIEMRTNGYYPKRPGQIPPEVAERAVSLYLAGSSLEAVAAELRLKVEHVSRILDERGVKRSRSEAAALAGRAPDSTPPGARPADLAAGVLDRYAAGESGVIIAGSLSLAPLSVYRVLEDCGLLRSHGEARRVREEGGRRPSASGSVRGALSAEVVEPAVARYLAGDSPRLIAP